MCTQSHVGAAIKELPTTLKSVYQALGTHTHSTVGKINIVCVGVCGFAQAAHEMKIAEKPGEMSVSRHAEGG